ncbi:MAG: exodeoxyribonuclease V subunit alpha [Fibrobacterales bacterium]
MDALLQTRCWIETIGPSEAALKGGIRPSEKEDIFFVAVYLLVESGCIDGAHLSLTTLSDRLLNNNVRDSHSTLAQLLIIVSTGLGHLYYLPGETDQEIIEVIEGYIERKKIVTQDVVLADQLVSLFDSIALKHQFSSAMNHVVSRLDMLGPVFCEGPSGSSLFVYDATYGFYTGKYFGVEKRLSLWLDSIIDTAPLTISPDLELAYNDVFIEKPMVLGSRPMHFHLRQQAAVLMAAQKQFSVISGGPGTGKTSTVVALLRVLVRLNPHLHSNQISMVAPTGRAAARMAESVEQSVALIPQGESDMKDSLLDSIDSQTIHRFLKYNPGRNRFTYGRDNKHPAKIVIIDEVSMVDAALFLNIIEALQSDTRIILLGDHNQLPSVQAGAVLSDLFGKTIPEGNPSLTSESVKALQNILGTEMDDASCKNLELGAHHLLKDSMVVLSKSHRSEASILSLSALINKQDAERVVAELPHVHGYPEWPMVVIDDEGAKRCNTQGTLLLEPGERTKERDPFKELLIDWCRFHLVDQPYAETSVYHNAWTRTHSYCGIIAALTKKMKSGLTPSEIRTKIVEDATVKELFTELFAYMNQSQILGVTRSGPVGTAIINQILFEYMQGELQYEVREGVYPGLQVMITQNDYTHGVFNGDCGVVIASGDNYFIAIPENDSVGIYPVSDIAQFDTAFAITVHKSQGSEYEYALIALPKEMNRVMTKEILYTAVTRAKYFAGIVGGAESVISAVGQSIMRRSGVSERILRK